MIELRFPFSENFAALFVEDFIRVDIFRYWKELGTSKAELLIQYNYLSLQHPQRRDIQNTSLNYGNL